MRAAVEVQDAIDGSAKLYLQNSLPDLLATTLYNALLRRLPQYRLLNVLGMSLAPMAVACIVETLVNAVLAASLAALIAFLLLDGKAATSLGGSFTQIQFTYVVDGFALFVVSGLAAVLALAACVPRLGVRRRQRQSKNVQSFVLAN